MRKLKIGILGCGAIAEKKIIPALNKHDHFIISSIASRCPDKLLKWAAELECNTYLDYDEMVSAPDIDAIYISLPPGLHFEWAKKAIEEKKHVYVEKPLTTNYNDTKRLVTLALEHNVALKEGYMFAYHNQNLMTSDLIGAGAIGALRSFSGTFCFPPLDKTGFRYKEALGGGSLLDAAGYPVKAASIFAGPGLNVVAASLNYQEHQVDIYGGAFLVSNDGLPCHINFGFDNFYQCRFEILGSKGKLIVPRAYTAGTDHQAIIELETASGRRQISAGNTDHFNVAFSKFHSLVDSHRNQISEHKDILEQARIIDDIKSKSIS